MKKLRVGIIGAGIQGVCNALFLQKKGFEVVLFDKEEPGSLASYGNAGHFSPYASVPLNRPDILSDVPAMLMSSSGPLALKWNYVPRMIPWFLKFIRNCTKKKMMHTAKYMHQILDISLDAYDELFADINLDGLVEKKGIMYVWEKKGIKSRKIEINIREKLGVKQKILSLCLLIIFKLITAVSFFSYCLRQLMMHSDNEKPETQGQNFNFTGSWCCHLGDGKISGQVKCQRKAE